jgi:hypothetical protein
LKIGEKACTKWALYLNKNYSYFSSKPFLVNAPVDWGACSTKYSVLSALETEKSMFHALFSSAFWIFRQSKLV